MNVLQLEPGMTVGGRYTLISVLGAGGMAVVFEAHDRVIQRRVALKILHKIDATARFEREARAASALHHPAVVKVFGIGTLPDGHPYIALEFIEGETLVEVINRVGRMPPERALTLMMPVVGAMAEAHACNIVHRDIKPSNLILQRAAGQFESLRLLDFGIALMDEGNERITQTGEIFGTPEFMAPEQAVGNPVGPPADVWALGAVMYELLAAEPPFSGTHAPGILYKVVNEPMPPLPDDVPAELADLVGECLAKDAAHRPATASVLLSKMEALLQREQPSLISSQTALPIRQPPPPLPAPSRVLARSTTMPPLPPSKGANRSWIAALTAVAVLGGLGIWWAMFHTDPAPVARPELASARPELTATALQAARGAHNQGSMDAAVATGDVARADAGPSLAGAAAPPSKAPRAKAPKTTAPKTAAPKTAAPKTAALKTAAPKTAAPKTAAPKTAAPKTAAPETAAPETAAPETTASQAPATAAPAPSLSDAQAHLDAGRHREALFWLTAHPGVGGAAGRDKVEASAHIGLNDMGRTAAVLRRMVKQHPTALDGALLNAVLRALRTQGLWRSLIPALSSARVRARVKPRLLAMARTGSPSEKERAQAVLDVIDPPAPKSDYEAKQTRSMIAQLKSASDCSTRRRLIIALGKLGQAAAIRPIEEERRAVGFSNVCMKGAIEDALKAIRAAQR